MILVGIPELAAAGGACPWHFKTIFVKLKFISIKKNYVNLPLNGKIT